MVKHTLGVLVAVGVCLFSLPAFAADITVLSSDAARVTGGDALIQLERPFTRVTLNGQDVSNSFGPPDPCFRVHTKSRSFVKPVSSNCLMGRLSAPRRSPTAGHPPTSNISTNRL